MLRIEAWTESIMVLLVGECPAVRAGVRAWLESTEDLAVVGDVETDAEAVQLARDLQPHVVVAGANLPEQTAIPICQQILACCPASAVLILATAEWDVHLAAAWAEGAAGVLPRRVDRPGFIQAIHWAAGGRQLFTPEQRERIRAWEAGVGRQWHSLTPREWEVLGLLLDGRGNRDLSAALALSENTLEKHVGAVLAKLGVASRAELLAFVHQNHLLAFATDMAESRHREPPKMAEFRDDKGKTCRQTVPWTTDRRSLRGLAAARAR